MRYVTILAHIVALFLLISLPVQAQDYPLLFTHTGEPESEWAGKVMSDVESVPIQFSSSKIERLYQNQTSTFSLPSPGGTYYNIRTDRVIDYGDGNWSVTGTIDGSWKNSFTMSFSDERTLSNINVISEHNFYQLRYDDSRGEHLMVEIDPHQINQLSCGVDHSHDLGSSDHPQTLDKVEDPRETDGPVVIDVMIVYTPQARAWANASGRPGINNIINESMAIAQQSADNSELNLIFNLVHRSVVEYTESGDAGTDLRRLTTSPDFSLGNDYEGFMDEVHQWRDEYGADLVALFTLEEEVGGVGWLLRDANGWPEIGFSITRVQQAGNTSTHAHEMGHNMGLAHSRNQQLNAAGDDGGLFTYSTGWRWTGNDDRRYTSVMTYSEGDTPINIFSNPDVNHQGVPTGSYTGQFSPADNSRSLREIKHIVSNYRQSFDGEIGPPVVNTSPVSAIGFSSARSGGNVVNDGGRFISDRGICWSTNPGPGLSDSCVSSGTGSGTFISTMTGLNEGTEYFVRAYAINSEGTSFGNERNFRTLSVEPPTVVTGSASNMGVSFATISGEVTDEGGSSVDDRGVCISKTPNPDTNDVCISDSDTGAGSFNINFTMLEHNTNYFARAYATNQQVTEYGEQIDFTTKTLHPPTVESVTGINATFFTISWADVDNADGYRLDVSENEMFDEFISGHENRFMNDETTYTVTGLQPGTEYYFRLRSEIETGFSSNSPTSSTTTLDISASNSAVEKSNERVLATGVQESEVVVNVQNSAGEPMPDVEVRIEPDGGNSVITEINPVTDQQGNAMFSITNNEEDTIHYTVIAGGLEFSQQFRIEFLFSKGELVLGNNFPNPFQGQTMIPVALPQATHVRIDLYNSGGAHIQTVINESFNTGYYEIPFTANGLSSGVYFYRMVTEDGIKTDKMLLIQ